MVTKEDMLLKNTGYLVYFQMELVHINDKISSYEMSIPRQIKDIAEKEANLETYRVKLEQFKRVRSTLDILISNETAKLKTEQGLI